MIGVLVVVRTVYVGYLLLDLRRTEVRALLEARSTGRYDSAVLGEVLKRVDAGEMSLNQSE